MVVASVPKRASASGTSAPAPKNRTSVSRPRTATCQCLRSANWRWPALPLASQSRGRATGTGTTTAESQHAGHALRVLSIDRHGSNAIFAQALVAKACQYRLNGAGAKIGFVTGMRITVPARPAWIALVLVYGVTIRDEGHREHVSGQADAYVEP